MTSFLSVVKPFSRVLATKDTTVVTKPLSITAVRAIRPIQSTLTIPAHIYTYTPPDAAASLATTRRLVFQYNCTASEDFTLTRIPDVRNYAAGPSYPSKIKDGYLVIRYRVGTTCYRYLLHKAVTGFPGQIDDYWGGQIDGFTSYTGQIIKKYFCLEFYSTKMNPLAPGTCGVFSEINYEASPINMPTTADPETFSLATLSLQELDDLTIALPESFPQSQLNIAWLDNV